MSGQIRFFRKNALDLDASGVTITASQGDDVADLARGRSLLAGWMTTGSVDADNTSFLIEWDSEQLIDSILLVYHNFKAYTIQYWNGAAFTNFSTTIAETTNADDTTLHTFTQVSTTKIKLIVTGTMVVNADKRLANFICTTAIGQFSSWPTIKKPLVGRNRQITKMLSGKVSVHEGAGNFSCTLSLPVLSTIADMTLIQTLYDQNDGFLVYLSGGDDSQFFTTALKPYRQKDVYLMKCADEFEPELFKGLYKSGTKVDVQLIEVVD